MKSYKPYTWKAEILLLLSANHWMTIGDMIVRGITYKAPQRIAELMKDGLVEVQISNKKNRQGRNLSEYRLKEQYFASKRDIDGKGTMVVVRPRDLLKQLF